MPPEQTIYHGVPNDSCLPRDLASPRTERGRRKRASVSLYSLHALDFLERRQDAAIDKFTLCEIKQAELIALKAFSRRQTCCVLRVILNRDGSFSEGA